LRSRHCSARTNSSSTSRALHAVVIRAQVPEHGRVAELREQLVDARRARSPSGPSHALSIGSGSTGADADWLGALACATDAPIAVLA
jgi:hypothetical protein